MNLYAISGLGADKTVFQYLKIDANLIPIDEISELINEALKEFTNSRFARLKICPKLQNKRHRRILRSEAE